MKTKTKLENYFIALSQNNHPDTVTLALEMINQTQRYLLEKYFNNESSFTLSTVANQQAYKFPQNYSKMKDVTIQVGAIRYTLQEVQTRKEWDLVNFVQWTSDIPQYYFIYDNRINIFPIPSSNGNTMIFNYKIRATDLSISDVTAGTVSVTVGSSTVTGSGTGWAPTVGINETRWIQVPFPNGDGQWYQVASVDSATQLTLYNAYQGTVNVTAAAYTLGQVPLLMEDFQDLLVYRPLHIYFSSINSDEGKAAEFKALYEAGIERLDEYANSKSTGVALEPMVYPINGNLYWRG